MSHAESLNVISSNVEIKDDYLYSNYVHEKPQVSQVGQKYTVKLEKIKYELKTHLKVPKVGVMLVGSLN